MSRRRSMVPLVAISMVQGELLAETDETGTIISCYMYCRGRLLAMISGGRTYFYHADPCGHIISLTDEQGNVAASYA